MLLRCIRAENRKLHASPIWFMFFILPIISAGYGTFNYLQNLEILRDGWYSLWTQHTLFYSLFFFPCMVAVYAAYLWRLEHIGHNWNLIMLNEFVEKILVHERARKGSQDTTQEIEIYFNFLGRYIPPSLQPVPLTPEEQEELRKKEERKDRLHQNYLKRKASGAQKRYEDKIKAKKKAEMDAKKALIRAEDMKKGVFSTIGQLPKEEPRKGSIAASAAV